jgi:hypothetical protein
LSTHYIPKWIETKTAEANQSAYTYKISTTNKGTDKEFGNILDFFMAIDLPFNKFEGGIPQLDSLDLSQNNLSGEIPKRMVQLNF